MIKKEQLNSIAVLRRLTPKNAEKEYVQELMLYSLYSLVGKELVFKGGTCLYKIHKLNRFSEDLDFDSAKGLDIDKLIKKSMYGLSLLGVNGSIKYIDSFENAVNVGINFKGPLYEGTRESLCFLLLNISTRQKTVLPPRLLTVQSIYREFPDFDVFAMDQKEILAEKVAAILDRDKPRDVYDLWFLMKRLSVEMDMDLVKKKLKKEFNKGLFLSRLIKKEAGWSAELERLIIGQLPPFAQVKKDIESFLSN